MSAPIWNSRWLRAERVLRGLTQEQFADLANMDVSTVASVERSADPGISNVQAYCYGLGMSVEDLVVKYGNKRATG